MKEGDAHLDDGCHFNTPIDIRRSISFLRVALCIFGIGYGLPWYGLAPSFNSKETGGNFQSPSVPSKSSSNLRSYASSELQCDVLRCAQLFFTMLGRSDLSYLASKNFHDAFGGITCAIWFLGKAGIELKHPGNARFEQVVDIPHGLEDIINGDGPFFEVPLKNQFGIWQYKFPLKIKLMCIISIIFLNFSIIMLYLQENCIQVQIPCM